MRKIRHEKAILNNRDKRKIRIEFNRIRADVSKIESEEFDSVTFICYARGIRYSIEKLLEVYEKRILADKAKKKN